MDNANYIALLGQYYGEPELTTFLSRLDISKPPKVPRGERDVVIENASQGIELTFTGERFLDFSFREYPEGALVLSNIFFHGIKTDDHDTFRLDLPLNLSYAMDKGKLTKLLGTQQWENAHGNLLRWDFANYCVSARFGDSGRMELLGIQLPNKYTMKKSNK